MMSVSKISSKYQITIPSDIRDALGAEIGDRVLFKTNRRGEAQIRILRNVTVDNLYGSLHREGMKFIPIEEARRMAQDELSDKERQWVKDSRSSDDIKDEDDEANTSDKEGDQE
jgi:AbrB family looped-hinge helix DNA binding protein